MQQDSNNSAKFAFFYMLSLVALIFMALSAGIIVFQIINKNIIDALQVFRGRYSSDALKFAISAIIISAPIYYLTVTQINKNLFKGLLDKDSGVRKWLTYFILFVSSVVMLGWLIATIYNFLDGELTVKFVLKALTAIAISTAIFTYYLYDIKRDNVVGVKDKVARAYFYGSLFVVIVVLVSAFIFVESPRETRNIKHDQGVINKFNQIDGAINTYYRDNKKLPESLDELMTADTYYLIERDIEDPATKKRFEYKRVDETTYELCAVFMTASKDYEENGDYRYYYDKRWRHEAGYQCLRQKVREDVERLRIID
jgi:hypothetical protein